MSMRSRPDRRQAEVFRNYKIDLEAVGFTILFEARQDRTKKLENVFANVGPGGQLFGYSPDEARMPPR